MTSEMAKERKDEKSVMKVLMKQGWMTNEEQPDALNAMSPTWKDEMTGQPCAKQVWHKNVRMSFE